MAPMSSPRSVPTRSSERHRSMVLPSPAIHDGHRGGAARTRLVARGDLPCAGGRRVPLRLVATTSGKDVLLPVAPADGGGGLRLEPAGIGAPVAKAARRIGTGIDGGLA